jgi:hypothetical protein
MATNRNVFGSIKYILIIPDVELKDSTPFQLFSHGLIERIWAIYRILELPSHIQDLMETRNETIARRAGSLGGYRLEVIPAPSDVRLRSVMAEPFTIAIYDPAVRHEVMRFAKHQRWPILPIVYRASDGHPSLEAITRDDIKSYIAQVLTADEFEPTESALLIGKMNSQEPWDLKTLDVSSFSHLLTRPSEFLLRSFGFGFSSSAEIVPPELPSDQAHIDAMVALHDEVVNRRVEAISSMEDFSMPESPALILTVAGMSKVLYKRGKKLTQ